MLSLDDDLEKALKRIDEKEALLRKAIAKMYKDNSKLTSTIQICNRDVQAREYIRELESIKKQLSYLNNVYMVSLEEMNYRIKASIFHKIEFSGRYCALVSIQEFPFIESWILYLAPVKIIYQASYLKYPHL